MKGEVTEMYVSHERQILKAFGTPLLPAGYCCCCCFIMTVPAPHSSPWRCCPQVFDTPADVAEKADRILTMLPSSPNVIEVYTGANGILK